jgi:hypothetical protein
MSKIKDVKTFLTIFYKVDMYNNSVTNKKMKDPEESYRR